MTATGGSDAKGLGLFLAGLLAGGLGVADVARVIDGGASPLEAAPGGFLLVVHVGLTWHSRVFAEASA